VVRPTTGLSRKELRRRRHQPLPELGAYLRSVVAGHVRYYGVPRNGGAIRSFRGEVMWLWWRALKRRSQRARLSWERMQRLCRQWLPPAHICHPYPIERLAVMTQGRSRVR
jgi:hypothetical protein